jgi:xylulokinase
MRSHGNEPVLIGIDVGTSSVKAVMTAPGGRRIDAFSGTHATRRATPGMAEQSPADWLTLVEAALARFAAHPRSGDVVAIGVTSQVNTHVFCGADHAPLRPAITWQDTRPALEAARLDARLSAAEKLAALGAPIPIDASHALSRMAWVAAHEPDLWASTAHVMLPKDWVIARLTGSTVADPLSAVGLAGPDLAYAPAIFGLLPRAESVLTPLYDPLSVAGPIAAGPFTGVPVATGTMDAWAAMFGLGVAREGQGIYLSGTSEVLGLISAARTGEPGVVAFPDWRGITLHAGPTQSGGASIDWLGQLLGRDPASLGAMADTVRITPASPLFLPHLEGERAPLWDAASRGAFAGLTSTTGPAEIAAAVMEGVAFSARLALEAVERSGARTAPLLRHGGGGAASDAWCQIRANVLGRPLERVAMPEAGAVGALVMAGVASGQLANLADATSALVTVDRQFEPDASAAAIAEARFALYQDLYRGVRPVSAGLLGA